jgi:arsenite/tail-anchored protein-transporting ATPase
VRVIFVGGKGGVGKTTCAAALAVARAEAGRRVLAISTDPAHSLGDVLRRRLDWRPRPVAAVRGRLDAVELDADRALDRWVRARRAILVTLGERGTYLDRREVERFMDLSFPGVSELVAVLEIERLARVNGCEEAVVDTAPTGHTLRLLTTPDALERLAAVLEGLQAKHRVLVEAVTRRYIPDAADRLVAETHDAALRLGAMLRDPAITRFVWVTAAEDLAIEETRDALEALARGGFLVDTIVVNRVVAPAAGCAACAARARAERESVRRLGRAALAGKHLRRVPLFDGEPLGVAALRRVAAYIVQAHPLPLARVASNRTARDVRARPLRRSRPGASALTRFVCHPPTLTFVMGKGGVGKTTCAAAMAVALAERHPARRVLLLSVDPAHSIGDVLDGRVGNDETSIASRGQLRARELDAIAEFDRTRERYRAAIDEVFDRLRGGSRFDAVHDRQVARDLIELAPPGLDELFALLAVIDLAGEDGRFDHVVIDMAPTGHALRLFAMRQQAHEWVRAMMSILLEYGAILRAGIVGRELVSLSQGLRRLADVLADERAAAIVPVTRAGLLPRAETRRLISALVRMRLRPRPFAIINAVKDPRAAASCDRCRADAASGRVTPGDMGGCAIILAPAVAPPPCGVRTLARWIAEWEQA